MNKKLKDNIKRVVGEGLGLIIARLKITKPSLKMETSLKKQSKKLAGLLKAEMKRQSKKKDKANSKNRKPSRVVSKGKGKS